MSASEIRVKIGLDGAAQVQAGAAAAAAAVGSLGDKVARFGTGATVSGQQTAQLSAQLQDFFVQVQAGGSPLTAFIQQGSQLSAVFGGFGNAARAVGALITPTVAAIGAAAGVVGTLGYAYVTAAREQEAFRRSIALTGNAAGVTTSQLNQLAKSAAVGSRGANAESLAQLVATGQVAVSVLAKANEAAQRLEREGGVAIKDTVQAFADLGKTPLESLKRLNDTQNFLTAATYKQVAALVDQGRAAEAAALAQLTFANEGIDRGKQLASSVGEIEKAWRNVTTAIRGAIDAIADIGRQDKPDADLARTQLRIVQLQGRLQGGRIGASNATDFLASDDTARKELAALQQLEVQLARGIETQRKLAVAQSERAAAADQGIKAIDREREAAKKAGDEFKRMAEAGRGLITSLALEDAGLSGDFAKKWEELNAALRSNPKLAEQVRVAQGKLLEQQPFIKKGLDDRAKALAEGAKAQDDYLRGLYKAIDGNDRELQALRDQYVELTAGKAAREDLVQARLDDAAAQAAQTLQAAEAAGAGEAEYERLSRIADQLRDVASLRRNVGNAAAAKDVADANAVAALKAQQEWERTAESIRDSLTDAFRRAFESGEDFGTAMAKTIGNELKARLASALSGLLADGVLNLAGLAVNSQGGGQGLSTLSTANSLATLYSGGAKAYSWATGGTAATGMTADFIAGYKGATLAAGQAGPTTAGATGAMGAGSSAGSSAAWLSTWGAAIALGVYKANQDYSQGFRRDQAREVSQSKFFGGGIFGDLNPMGGMESTKADLLSKLGFSDRLADLLSGSTAVAALLGYSSPQIKNAGITGSISGGDFSGAATAQAVQKAGFVRKLFGSDDKVTDITTALPDEIGRFLDAGAAGILAKAKDYGAALGLPVTQLGSVSQAIAIKANEEGKLTEEALVEALSGYGDALVKGYAAAVAPLAVVGETTAQTLARVGQSITGVNDVLGVLGLKALQASIEGGKAAVSLEDLFGGLATLQQAAGSYLQSYYTDAERAALSTKSIGEALNAFGLAVPSTREAFRTLVEAQDLTTQSGREAFTVLMSVSEAFAAIVPSARSAADILAERTRLENELLAAQGNTAALRERELAALDPANRLLQLFTWAIEDQAAAQEKAADVARDAANAAREAAEATAKLADAWRNSVNGAVSGVQAAYGAVKSAVQTAQQAAEADAQKSIQTLRSTSDEQLRNLDTQAREIERTFSTLLDSLRGNIQALTNDLAGDGGRGAALATLQDAQRTLRRGGAVDMDAVRSAGDLAARIDTGNFATRVDFAREQAGTINLLRDVSAAARAQMTGRVGDIAAQQVAIEQARDAQIAAIEQARDAQLATLAAQLEEARAAASALVSIDDGVQSVADAINRLTGAMGALALLQGNGGPTGQILQSGDTQVYGSAGGAVATRQVGAGWDGTLVRGRSGATTTADVLRQAVDGLVAADNWARIVEVARAEGIDSNMLDGIMDWRAGTALAAAQLRGLPRFAMGTGYVPSTGPAIVHKGERIIPAEDNSELMRLMSGGGNDELAPLVRALLAELSALRQGTMDGLHANASATGATARLLTDVIKGGASIATRAEA